MTIIFYLSDTILWHLKSTPKSYTLISNVLIGEVASGASAARTACVPKQTTSPPISTSTGSITVGANKERGQQTFLSTKSYVTSWEQGILSRLVIDQFTTSFSSASLRITFVSAVSYFWAKRKFNRIYVTSEMIFCFLKAHP